MENQIGASSQALQQKKSAAAFSLAGIAATIILASITHASESDLAHS